LQFTATPTQLLPAHIRQPQTISLLYVYIQRSCGLKNWWAKICFFR